MANYPDLTGIDKLRSRGRSTHTHWDGVENQKTFYVDPFSKGPAVLEALKGSVFQHEDTKWERILPAVDPYYPLCYCNEARIDHIDASKESIAASPWEDLDLLNDPAPAGNHEKNILEFLEQVGSQNDQAAGGCFITASYRPLISAYLPSYRPEMSFADRQRETSKMFDWIEPHFSPAIRTVPWPDGLIVNYYIGPNTQTREDVPTEVAQPIHVPVIEFTVRRLLVGKVPWETIRSRLNTVNHAGWPAQADDFDLPPFFRGTLKYNPPEIIEHYSRLAKNHIWYEIIQHFSWINYITHPVFDSEGRLERGVAVAGAAPEPGLAPVTWNHVFMRPGKARAAPDRGGLGWYFVKKFRPAEQIWQLPDVQGPIYEFSDFDDLFNLQAN